MDYKRIHDQIIDRAKTRILSKELYIERHHITPRCLGGDNSKENLIALTAREHYLVHWLLYKIHNTRSLGHAWHRMCNAAKTNIRYTSHTFAYARKAHAKLMTEPKSDQHKSNISKGHTGRTQSPEHAAKSRVSNLGKHHSVESKAKISAAMRKRYEDPIVIEAIRTKATGRKHSEETKAKMRLYHELQRQRRAINNV